MMRANNTVNGIAGPLWLIIMCMIGSAMCWSAEPSYPPQDDAETQQVEAIVHGGGMSVRAGPSIQGEVGIGGGTAMPAWAAKSLPNQEVTLLLPFGANMFQGYFTNTRPSGLGARYVIMPGDGIAVKVWGTRSFEGTQVVDHQGNIFIPEVGPITVAGLAHRQLNEVVRRRLRESYPTGVDVYTNLLSAQPLSVYVSGFVNKPGYYAGGPADSVLSFIDRAGGIVNQRGSYRCIKIMRRNRQVAVLDLYMFLLSGILPEFRLEENDVILVQERGPSVAVLGDIRQQARYEFPPSQLISPGISSFSGRFSGAELMLMASPVESVSHVLVSGIRESGPFNLYLTKEDFSGFMLADNDVVEFVTDRQSDGILVMVAGEVDGNERYPLKKGTYLRDFLAYVPVNPITADVDAIYLRRRSVAEQQKRSIADGLRRLEQMSLTATSASPAEAELRAKEAEMIQNFVRRASILEPDGVVVVRREGWIENIILEDGDIVVIPPKRQVVQVSGEVLLPKVLAYRSGQCAADYIAASGGFSRRADRKNILIVRPNGEVINGNNPEIRPGDHVLVLPRYESKNLLLVKDLTQILYQIAVATKVAVGL